MHLLISHQGWREHSTTIVLAAAYPETKRLFELSSAYPEVIHAQLTKSRSSHFWSWYRTHVAYRITTQTFLEIVIPNVNEIYMICLGNRIWYLQTVDCRIEDFFYPLLMRPWLSIQKYRHFFLKKNRGAVRTYVFIKHGNICEHLYLWYVKIKMTQGRATGANQMYCARSFTYFWSKPNPSHFDYASS